LHFSIILLRTGNPDDDPAFTKTRGRRNPFNMTDDLSPEQYANRFCVRARQATAQPAKYVGAPGRPRKQGQPRPATGRLMIAVLGGLADVQRDLIRTRTAEGRSRAQKLGQHMGRPAKLTPAQKAEARRRRAQGATLAELARSYHVGKSTISRL
jgi:Resolvase, N terminal domain/CENP-B N-terminal DNA-binding domain